MTMGCWTNNSFTRHVTRPIRKAAPRRTRLGVELLEDRRVPATITVTNIRDDGSAGTLR